MVAAPDLPCIWVQAGVLSYRLCDREYQCDRCELFHALRSDPLRLRAERAASVRGATPEDETTSTDERTRLFMSRFLAGCRIALNRSYSPSHFWVQVLDEGWRIGLDGFARRVLDPIDQMILPDFGARLQCGEPCAWARRSGSVMPLPSPVGGTVAAANPACLGPTVAATGDPTEDPWMLLVNPGDEVGVLYRDEQILLWLSAQIGVVRQRVTEALDTGRATGLGATLADGGAIDVNLGRVLGPRRFEALARELFPVDLT